MKINVEIPVEQFMEMVRNSDPTQFTGYDADCLEEMAWLIRDEVSEDVDRLRERIKARLVELKDIIKKKARFLKGKNDKNT